MLAAKGPAAYAGLLAALYAGATVVPLRPDFPAARTRQMIDAAGVTAVIADERAAAGLGDVLEGRTDVAVLVPGRDRDWDAPFATLDPDPAGALTAPLPIGPGDAAYVLFTSGSTGRPKGVVITHAATDHYFGLLDDRYDFGPHDVFSQSFDLNFDCGLFDVFCAWGRARAWSPSPPRPTATCQASSPSAG
ncbi:AMP-binding protein [Streptomyces sp. MS1.HAVA.3]|uniref:AMP-binding protein n=1 Tax=Streptomyces caledonius TaxID=3134107 RepID=A0ABU8U269_9ACTN